MPASVKRHPHQFVGGLSTRDEGLTIGTNGNEMTKIAARIVSACAPVVAAHNIATGSAAMVGVAVGDIVFVTGSNLGGSLLGIQQVTAASTNGLFITWCNTGSVATAASTVTFSALAVTPG